MRMLRFSLAIATIASLGAPAAVAQSTEGPAGPAAAGESPQSRPTEQPRGMPGIYVTPPPQRRAPAAPQGDAEAPAHDGTAGCRYVPRKLDLIV